MDDDEYRYRERKRIAGLIDNAGIVDSFRVDALRLGVRM